MNQSDAERNPLDVVAEEFAQRCRRGEQPTIAEYTRAYPNLAEELEALLPSVAMMEQLKTRPLARPPAPPPRLERLGDYHILREIGRGGMGIVYEAEHQALGRHVALKVLPTQYLSDSKRLQRFQREAQAAARLHHTNIVPVFGIGECDGMHYYVMQFVQGRGLNDVLNALRQPAAEAPAELIAGMPRTTSDAAYWRWVAHIGVQVAEALQYAHEHGVLHRDVKPANIVLDQQGTAWVTDFGLAKLAEQSELTAAGEILGTLQYLAPETLQGQNDARSDVCSLGLTLYELVTLRTPYTQTTPSHLLRQISEEEPTPPRRLNPLIPRDLETIVQKASARHAADRYQSAAELADDLRSFLDDRPIRARQTHLLERAWRWCRRNRTVAALALLAVLSLLLALAVGWVGYVKTTAALAGESQRRRDADAATRRAEANVAMSLEALEEMFNQIEPADDLMPFAPPLPPPPPGQRPPPQAGKGESRENAALLQSILKFYDRFAAENAADSRLQAEAAKAHRRIGDIHQRLGEFDPAQAAYTRALAMGEKLYADHPDRPEYAALVAEVHGRLGALLRRTRQAQPAEEHLRQALTLAQMLAQKQAENGDYLLSLSLARFALGEFLRQNQPQEARTLVEQSIAELQAYRKTNAKRGLDRSLGVQYRCLAEILSALGERRLADDARRKAEDLGVGPPPPPPPPHPPDAGPFPPPRPRPDRP